MASHRRFGDGAGFSQQLEVYRLNGYRSGQPRRWYLAGALELVQTAEKIPDLHCTTVSGLLISGLRSMISTHCTKR
jgi:hypothetical protein